MRKETKTMEFTSTAATVTDLEGAAAKAVGVILSSRGWRVESVRVVDSSIAIVTCVRTVQRDRGFERTTEEQWQHLQKRLATVAIKRGWSAVDYTLPESPTPAAVAAPASICRSCGCDNELTIGDNCFVCAAPLRVERENIQELIAKVKSAVTALEKAISKQQSQKGLVS